MAVTPNSQDPKVHELMTAIFEVTEENFSRFVVECSLKLKFQVLYRLDEQKCGVRTLCELGRTFTLNQFDPTSWSANTERQGKILPSSLLLTLSVLRSLHLPDLTSN